MSDKTAVKICILSGPDYTAKDCFTFLMNFNIHTHTHTCSRGMCALLTTPAVSDYIQNST